MGTLIWIVSSQEEEFHNWSRGFGDGKQERKVEESSNVGGEDI
jgi:hypothetical protein